MCIRDSAGPVASLGRTKIPIKKLSSVTPATVKSKRLCSSAVILAIGSKRIVAVSYTHLDVYKRQVHIR